MASTPDPFTQAAEAVTAVYQSYLSDAWIKVLNLSPDEVPEFLVWWEEKHGGQA